MKQPDPAITWLLHPRRHRCGVCTGYPPVKRIESIEVMGLGFRVVVQCHGQQREQVFSRSFTEDYGNRTIVWWGDYLRVSRLDRHGRLDGGGVIQ